MDTTAPILRDSFKPRPNPVRASEVQRIVLVSAFKSNATPSNGELVALSNMTGLDQHWIGRWFSRQRLAERRRAATLSNVSEGVDASLAVKRELVEPENGILQNAQVPRDTGKPTKRWVKQEEEDSEGPSMSTLSTPYPSSPYRSSSPGLLPSSSPPRTPPHICSDSAPSIYQTSSQITGGPFPSSLSSDRAQMGAHAFKNTSPPKKARRTRYRPIAAKPAPYMHPQTTPAHAKAIPLRSADPIPPALCSVASGTGFSAGDKNCDEIQEVLSSLNKETNVAKIALLLARLRRLGLMW